MEEIAEVYSRALFEAARDNDVVDRIHEELGEVDDALREDGDLRCSSSRPTSPRTRRRTRRKVVDGADERLVNFLELLAERHRMPLLPRIRRQFDERWAETSSSCRCR